MKSRHFNDPTHEDLFDSGACPHCGSTDGFYMIFRQTFTQYYTWNDVPIDASEPSGTIPIRQYCTGCKRRVNGYVSKILNTAAKTSNPTQVVEDKEIFEQD